MAKAPQVPRIARHGGRRRIYLGSDRVSPADARATLETEPAELPVVSLRALKRLLAKWRRDWSRKRERPLRDLATVFRRADRVVALKQLGHTLTRSFFLFDKACDEFIEFKSLAVFRGLSLALVEWIDLTPEAEIWAERHLSGRIIKSDGLIVLARPKAATSQHRRRIGYRNLASTGRD